MPQPLLDLDLPATPESATVARKAVAEALRDVPVDRDAVVAMVSEAVANCAAHAYPEREGRVRVHVESTGDALDVVVSDDGVGMRAAAESSGFGLGVPLMDDLADERGGRRPARARASPRASSCSARPVRTGARCRARRSRAAPAGRLSRLLRARR